MPTSNRGYETPSTGSDVDTWGDVLNANAGLIDNNLGGVSSIALSNTDVTLNTAQAQCGTIILSGSLGDNLQLIFPAVSGWWTVINQCTVGAFWVRAMCPAGTNRIGLPPGEAIDICSNGTSMFYRNLCPSIGNYADYAGAAVPAWVTGCTVPPFLLCDGSSFSGATYPILNTIMGTTTLPDYRGRMSAFLDGGTGRITNAGSGVDGSVRFSAGGQQNRTVALANLPSTTLSGSTTGNLSYDRAEPGSLVASATGGSGTQNLWQAGGIFSRSTSGSLSVSIALGGSDTALQTLPPVCIAGIRMIRAA